MKKQEYIVPSAKAISVKPVRILAGSPQVTVNPDEEESQSGAESLDLSFEGD